MNKTKMLTVLILTCLAFSIFSLTPIQPVKASYSYSQAFYSTGMDGYAYVYPATTYVGAHNATTGTLITDNTIFAGQSYYLGDYSLYRGFVYFDTSAIPNEATVTSAKLELTPSDTISTNFHIVIQDGQPNYPHEPFVSGDFYSEHYSGMGGNVSNTDLTQDVAANITLSDDGLEWIQVDDFTKLCLRSDADINYTAPIAPDYRRFYDAEDGQDVCPVLYVTYTMTYQFSINIHGPYDEEGLRDYDGINCTLTRPNQETQSFELNGTEAKTAQYNDGVVLTYDIGGNYSRVYYLRYNQRYEDIYVFYPDELYATYYISLVDLIGINNGYLESILNINGTDRVIERQKIDVVNEIPFILSWGTSYKFRLVCDEGTYTWESVVAGPDTTLSLTATSVTFDEEYTKIGNITMSCERTDSQTITFTYEDEEELTEWVYVAIYEYGTTDLVYSTNNTGNTQSITWDSAVPTVDYTVYVEISHIEEGSLSWQFDAPYEITGDNPFDLDFLGEWGPIDSSQIVGTIIVVCVFGAFSRGSVDIGIVATLLTAGVLNLIGWLNLDWTYYGIIFAVGMIAIVALRRHGGGEING